MLCCTQSVQLSSNDKYMKRKRQQQKIAGYRMHATCQLDSFQLHTTPFARWWSNRRMLISISIWCLSECRSVVRCTFSSHARNTFALGKVLVAVSVTTATVSRTSQTLPHTYTKYHHIIEKNNATEAQYTLCEQ